MNKEAKFSVLKALKIGIISKGEAKDLIRSKGIIILDLSTDGNQDPINSILEKMPSIEMHFKNIISLGDGKRP